MARKKETGTRQPELHEIIKALNQFKKRMYDSDNVSPTKFMAMQSAIFGAKCIVRDLYGAPRKKEKAWVK